MKKGKLKGSDIFIHEDTSLETREQEKQLRGEMKRLRAEGKYAVIRSGKLITKDNRERPPAPTADVSNKRALSVSPEQTQAFHKRVNMNKSDASSLDDLMEVVDQQNAADVQQTSSTRDDFPPLGNVASGSGPSVLRAPVLNAGISPSTPPVRKSKQSTGRDSSQPSVEDFFRQGDQTQTET